MVKAVCPHCQLGFKAPANVATLAELAANLDWRVAYQVCTDCDGIILDLVLVRKTIQGPPKIEARHRVWPKGSGRAPAPPEVPPDIAQDYTEACLVLNDSAKAAAALGRRCLQHVLRTAAGVKHGDLAKEIQQVLDEGTLPSHIAESIDAVRNVGNFAAHPIKGEQSGEILPVEPGEAEWTLDVLELLFDFYFVQPARTQVKRAALDAKLAEAGKPPMK